MNIQGDEFYQSLEEYEKLFCFRTFTDEEVSLAKRVTRKGMRDGVTPNTYAGVNWNAASIMVSIDEKWGKAPCDRCGGLECVFAEDYPLTPSFVTVFISAVDINRQLVTTMGAAKRMKDDEWNLDLGIRLAITRALTTSVSVLDPEVFFGAME